MTLLIAKLVHEVAHDRGNVVATGEAKRGQHCVILALDLCTCVYEVRHGLGSFLAEYVGPQRFAGNLSAAGFLDSYCESWTARAVAEASSDLAQIDRRGVEFLRQFIAARWF